MSVRSPLRRRLVGAWGLVVPVLVQLAAAPGSRGAKPVLAELRDLEPKIPVILVPGATGVELRNADTGKTVWGRGIDLLSPRDGGYGLARPIPGPNRGDDPLVPGEVLEEVRLAGLIRKPIYGPIFRLMEANGYRRGDLDAPHPEATFFAFAYDWRLSNADSAAALAERLESLRRRRGEESLSVALICQSNGVHLCRYLAKYGGAPLEQAQSADRGPGPGLEVAQLFLVGSASGGSVRILREIDRGRRYLWILGRRWRPEVLFTLPSLYEELPSYRRDLFVDESGTALDIDLYDPESWRRHGWSVYGESARRRLERRPRPDLFGDEQARDEFLRRTLAAAQRFQRLLARDAPGFGATRYYLIRSLSEKTPERALLLRRGDRWRTLFTGDTELRGQAGLEARVTAAGDGHATEESQMWLSPQERAALAREPLSVERGTHFELILDPETRRFLLEALYEGNRAAAGEQGSEAPSP